MAKQLTVTTALVCLWGSAALALSYDLEMTDVSCPTVVTAGQAIVVTNTVEETSGKAALTTFTVGVYFSVNAAIDPATDTWLNEWTVSGGLAGFGSATDSTPVTIPSPLAPGTYFIGAYADINDDLPLEQQEGDNDRSIAITVSGSAPPAPWAATPLGGGCAPSAGGEGDRTGSPGAWIAPWLLALALLVMTRRRGDGKAAARFGLPGILLLLLVTAAGCAGGGPLTAHEPLVFPAGLTAGVPVEAARLASYLPAAMPGEDRASVVGARAGILTTVGEDKAEYDGSITFGAFYPGRLPDMFGLGPIPFEAGLDFAFVESDDGTVDATLLLFRFDCLFSRWEALGSEADLYVVGGFQIVDSTADVPGKGDKGEFATALDVGVGASWAEKGWDARFTWSILLGSDNIGSLFLFTGGYRF